MAKLETNFNVSPYFDDYETSAKLKDYHRILFKPGLAVQTRELTQLQTILQEQVARFGDNIYKDGTVIDGCDFQYDANVSFVKLRDNDSGGNTVTVSTFANVTIQGVTSGVRAKVIATTSGAEVDAPDYNTFIVKYLDGGTDKVHKTFDLNEELVYLPADGGSGQRANTISSGAFGFGSIFHTGGGIIFQKGHFINVDSQVIILEKYSTTPSYKVGFKTVESIVTSVTDTTLLDNATGSYNYTAPGADRLKLTPNLVKRRLTDTSNTENLLPLFKVENGNVQIIKKDTEFNSIARELAKRTYEESGNYQLRHINAQVKEHLNTGSNFGRFSSGEGGDKNKLAIGIEPGIAYIQGYRNETLTTEYIETTKAITTNTETSLTVTTNFGNYVIVNELCGPWDMTQYSSVSLRDTAGTAVSSGTLGAASAAGSEIGTAKVRGIEWESGSQGNYTARYRLYLFDIKMTASNKSFGDVRSLYINNPSGPDSSADTVLETVSIGTTGGGSSAATVTIAVLKDADFNKGIWKLGTTATKQLSTTSGTVNASYEFKDKASLSFTGATGTASLTLSGVHPGGTEELPFGVGALNDSNKRTFTLMTQSTINATAGFTGSIQHGANTLNGIGPNFNTLFTVGDFVTIGNANNYGRIVSIDSANTLTTNPTIDGTTNDDTPQNIYRIYPQGHIFDLTENGTNNGSPTERTVTVTSTTEATFDLQEVFTTNPTMTLFFNNKRETAVGITKTVRKNRFIRLNLSTHSAGIAGPWSLGVADAFNLRAVYVGSTYNTQNRNLVKEFRIWRNTNDNIYGTSRLQIKPTSDVVLKTTDRIVVEFDYFEHNRSGGIGFSSVDSYSIDPNESTANTTAITTPQIPRFSSTTTNQVYDLRDSLDFRPRVTSASNTNLTTLVNSAVNPAESTTLDIDGTNGSYVPVPDKNFTSDVVYYLPRVDRVVIGKNGTKKVVKGIPAVKAYPPAEPAEVMTIALLNIPAYPSLSYENALTYKDPQTDSPRVDLAVRVKPFFQRRYTMQDISGIESRIDRLEYYTALNILEKSARDLNVPDGNGLDRFKNGIFVDSFFGTDNSNITDPAYSISMNTKLGELIPKYDLQNIDIAYNTTLSTNVTNKNKAIRLDLSSNTNSYQNDDVVYLGSSFGSATATGTVRSVVSNTSNVRLYLHNTTGTFTVSSTLKRNGDADTGVISVVQTSQPGALLTLPYTNDIYIDQPYASKLINPVGELTFNWIGNLNLIPEADHFVDTTTEPDVQLEVDIASSLQGLDGFTQVSDIARGPVNTTREVRGVAFVDFQGAGGNQGGVGFGSFADAHSALDDVKVTSTQTETITKTRINVEPFTRTQRTGAFITRTDIVPFMRSREVQFTATGLRPNTRVYPYFDNILVNDYVKPTTKEYANTGAFKAALNSNANGAVYGVFIIPNNDTLKFRVGERPFKLQDIANTTTQDGTQTTSATKNFISSGLASSERGIELTTREARITTDTTSETNTVTISEFEGVQLHRDPVAQSFSIGDFEFQNLNFTDNKFGNGADGIFISCIDLYFSEKSSTAGIAVEIREVVNGSPTGIRVPFGFKRINPEDVNVSNDGSLVTPFYFDEPVYLRGDKEYCFVVKPEGSDPSYRLWIAELGGIDTVTGALIDQQPAVGVMFTSANDRTYTPRQNQDICFTIWRANFDTTVTGSVVYTNEDDEYMNATQFSSTRFQIGEKIRGESILKMTSNTAPIGVNDTVTLGANTGKVRKIVSSNNTPWIKVDMKGTIADGSTITFANGSGSFTGVLNTSVVNTATGFVQYYSAGRNSIVANGSSGTFSSNTTADDGFYRGQVTNASAQVYGLKDYKYDTLKPIISYIKYNQSDVVWTANVTSNTYVISQAQDSVEAFIDNEFITGEKIIASRTNEVNNTSSKKTLRITGSLTSSTSRLSPVVDIGRSRSTIVTHNIINNVNTKEIINQGLANSRYISKKIVLADGQEAEDIKVILTAYKPSGAEVDIYCRIQNAEDPDDFSDKHYTKLTQITSANTISSRVNTFDYREFEYGFPSANASNLGAFKNSGNNDVVRYHNGDGAAFDTFKHFSIKIVLRSSVGSHVVPRVRDLRAIALQV